MRLILTVQPEVLAVCRLPPGAPPSWALEAPLFCIARTRDELSIVCEERRVPDSVPRQGGFRALRLAGTIDFAVTGVVAGLTAPLAAAAISVFVFSTYDTDWLLVRATALPSAIAALRRAGATVNDG